MGRGETFLTDGTDPHSDTHPEGTKSGAEEAENYFRYNRRGGRQRTGEEETTTKGEKARRKEKYL